MQARGPLMMEHRVIERMVGLIEHALAQIESLGEVDIMFVSATVDFIRTYADHTHHGKEEDILFRELDKKNLSPEHRALMDRLLQDHAHGREVTAALTAAGARYCAGDASALADIVDSLEALVTLYPRHIEQEDKIFFPATRAHFTDEEEQAMLAEFWETDRKAIHEKYKAVVRSFGG